MKFEDVNKYTTKKLTESLKVINLDNRYIAKGQALKYFPIAVSKVNGSKVWDLDNNQYIDFLTSAAVYNIGHNHPKVVEAVKRQVDSYLNYTIAYLYTEPSVMLAKKLTEITPGSFDKKVSFGHSGGDAVDSAMKVARAYTKKRHILVYDNSYHGTTYGSLSATMVTNKRSRESVFPMRNITPISYPDPYRNKWNIDGYERPDDLIGEAVKNMKNTIKKLNGNVAALILEPIQGDSGIIVPPAGFFKEVKKICDDNNILFASEEVQTGMGRTGKWWAIEHFGAEPDILITGKGLGGGMSISAVVGRTEIMDSVDAPLLVFTHGGHATSAAAALATIDVINDEKLIDRANEIGKYVMTRFEEIKNKYEIIGDVRGKGLMIGVDIVKTKKNKEPDKATAQKIIWRAWEKGLILATIGRYGNVLRIAPPLNISREDLDTSINIIEESLRDTINGKVPDEISEFLSGW